MRPTRLAAGLVAGGVAAAVVAVVPTAFGAERAAPPPAPVRPVAAQQSAATPADVTLITGDRVTVTAAGGVAYRRAPGRAGVRFVTWTVDGHRYVVPSDALPLIRQGRLDRRLFDVTLLREFGYTAGRELPLLVAYPRRGANRGPGPVRAAVGSAARVGRDLRQLGLLSMRPARADRAGLWTSLTRQSGGRRGLRPGVERVYLDGKRRPSLDVSVPQVGAPAAWEQGLDGTGVTVAVLDSGIDATHPDFAGKIVASENFTDEPGTDDRRGHGTHVASIVAGTGARSGGKHKGVAPGAKLAIGKVCLNGFCPESAVLAGMEWAARTAPVVNISLGGPDAEGTDPLEQAVEDLTAAHDTLFVIAAGNQGFRGPRSVDSPAAADSALAVGAVDDDDRTAPFSARGPRDGDSALKPEITAPGVGIVAAAAAHGTIGDPAGDGYVREQGTSMAAPHVAGAAAIVVQRHPGLSAKERKALLMAAARPVEGTGLFEQGAGRLDVARAVRQTVFVVEGSVNFPKQMWPHHDDVPVTRTLTYRNTATEPVALSLAVRGDTGTFTLGTTSLTVPAGGTATTTLTADTRGEGTDGIKTAHVVASAAGDVRVETPAVVEREVESYDVTFRHIGRDGGVTPDFHASLIGIDVAGSHTLTGAGEADTLRLPKGAYGVVSTVYEPDRTILLAQPELLADAPKTVTLDTRQARPVRVTPPRADARQATVSVSATWTTAGGGSAGVSADSVQPGDLLTAQVGTASRPEFVSSVNSVFARWKNDDEGFLDSPYTYETAYFRTGTFYTGFEKRIDTRELAPVKVRYAREADGATGVRYNWPGLTTDVYNTAGLPVSLPFERTEYLGTEGGVQWWSQLDQEARAGDDEWPQRLTSVYGSRQRYTAGRVHRQDWNRAVFGPVAGEGVEAVVRRGDEIRGSVPLFGDGDGHWGRSEADRARVALYSGDRLIGEADPGPFGDIRFPVPAGHADYRLEMSATRSAPHRLSTRVDAAWTFPSAGGDTGLPLSTVRFSPRLDPENNAPAGRFDIPVTVVRAPASTAAPNRTLTAEFSVDDGRTWQPATVRGQGDRRTLRVTNPADGFVSLRTTATDAAGRTTTLTVVRAYAVR